MLIERFHRTKDTNQVDQNIDKRRQKMKKQNFKKMVYWGILKSKTLDSSFDENNDEQHATLEEGE